MIAGLAALLTASCAVGPQDKEALGQASNALTGQESYLYFTCGATGWQPSDATRMLPLDNMGIDYGLDFEVTQPWMVSGQDSCVFLTTNELNGWGTQQTWTGGWADGENVTDHNHLEVVESATGRLLPDQGQFTVTYPSLGKYSVRLTYGRSAFTIQPTP